MTDEQRALRNAVDRIDERNRQQVIAGLDAVHDRAVRELTQWCHASLHGRGEYTISIAAVENSRYAYCVTLSLKGHGLSLCWGDSPLAAFANLVEQIKRLNAEEDD